MQGYNYCFKKSKYNLDQIESELKNHKELDYIRSDYGIFFKSEQYEEVMECLTTVITK